MAVGPFEDTFHTIAGAHTLMMLAMWAAEWPLDKLTSAGEPSMSTNPIVDYHII